MGAQATQATQEIREMSAAVAAATTTAANGAPPDNSSQLHRAHLANVNSPTIAAPLNQSRPDRGVGSQRSPAAGEAPIETLAAHVAALKMAIPAVLAQEAQGEQQRTRNHARLNDALLGIELLARSAERRALGVEAGLIEALDPVLEALSKEAAAPHGEQLQAALHRSLELTTGVQ
jgi:hypothetical protein